MQEDMYDPELANGSESESGNDTAEVDTFSKTSSGIQYCKSGHRSKTAWMKIMRHCKQLLWQNKEYALHVVGAVSSTLSGISAERSENGPTITRIPPTHGI
jgi:hypothetical protein